MAEKKQIGPVRTFLADVFLAGAGRIPPSAARNMGMPEATGLTIQELRELLQSPERESTLKTQAQSRSVQVAEESRKKEAHPFEIEKKKSDIESDKAFADRQRAEAEYIRKGKPGGKPKKESTGEIIESILKNQPRQAPPGKKQQEDRIKVMGPNGISYTIPNTEDQIKEAKRQGYKIIR